MDDTSVPITGSGSGSAGGGDGSFLAAESTSSQIGNASGSFQNDGFLSTGGTENGYDTEFGFQRAEMGTKKIAGTVQLFDRHLFLCYKTPEVWPSHVEASEFDRLPRLLSAELKARKADMKKRTRLTICEGEDGTESPNGDVLIFPEMIRYRCLTHYDVGKFVEEALVKDAEWVSGTVEILTGSYVFVCAHGSRDKRCGVCGPALVKKFKEEIKSHGLEGQVSVSSCSHIGGHKYAGNVIIFSPNVDGEVTGHWYGYVSPDDVPTLLELHIGRGEIVPHLWRGQMGLSEEDQKKAHELRIQPNGEITNEKSAKEFAQTETIDMNPRDGGCCQAMENSSCCQNFVPTELQDNHKEVCDLPETATEKGIKPSSKSSSSGKGTGTRKTCALPTWFECWEREDTYAALAVATAAVSVAIAYGLYQRLK